MHARAVQHICQSLIMLKIASKCFKDIKDESRLDGIVGIANSLQVRWEDPFPTLVESSPTKYKSAL
jgi:hypothetical protein